jgi:SAM-dependent methyltransferase
MQYNHYKKYLADKYILQVLSDHDGEIISGIISAKDGSKSVEIRDGIPRFEPDPGYAANFGLQWNTFRSTQLDSHSGLPLTFNRFWNNTHWKPKDVYGKTVLEVGSGAGRFTEILLDAGAKVVSFDLTSAVDANKRNNFGKGDLFLFQGSIYDMPLRNGIFDYVFCYGVLQHTPDPVAAYREIFAKLAPGGSISIDYYRKLSSPSAWTTPKYLWRPLTSAMKPERLFQYVKFYVPLWLPFDTFLRKTPVLFRFLPYIPIPCWNYLNMGLTREQRREWAIMDTFDALGAKYDFPKTLNEIVEMVASEENRSSEVFFGSNGIVANVTRLL